MRRNRYFSEKSVAVSEAAYTSGDQFGPLLEFTDAFEDGTGVELKSLSVLDKEDLKPTFDILLFSSQPTIASSDNAAISISDTEMEKCIGIINVAAADFTTISGNAVATKRSLNLVIKNENTQASSKKSLWAVCVVRAAPDYTAGSQILIRLGLEVN